MLADLKKTKTAEKDSDKYNKYLAKQNERKLATTARGQDIGAPPPVKNQKRRDACGDSLRLFCETYFPAKFSLKWSPDHIKVIDRLQSCVRGHGLFALAMPRGSGKTELSKRAAEWGMLYGYRKFVMLIGAAEDKADQLIEDIKYSFESNDLLHEDFPEACYPIRKLEGETRRCLGQRCNGERTKIVWKADEIRLPLVKGSKCAGAVIRTAGLTGAIRGASTTGADGGTMRPDLAILDDPQTRKSAGSLTMNNEREAIIRGDVIGLAGPNRSVTCVMPCTVVYPGDLADRMLARDRNPQWNGERMQAMYSPPTNTALWDQYANARADGFRAGDNGEAGNVFYDAHRAELDAGCVVAWPERFDPEKSRSAIQECMNRKLDDPAAFAAECQNEPLDLNPAAANALDPEEIAKRFENVPRLIVPRGHTRVTAFIDVGDHLLWYAVVAWDQNFGGTVIDYGPYPDQGRNHFHSSNPSPALGDLPEAHGQPADFAITCGLEKLTARILGRDYKQEETGATFNVERCLIDANYGPRTEAVYKFIRRYSGKGNVIASHGKFYGASSQPINSTIREGELPGMGWTMKPGNAQHGRYVLFDANYWKTFVAERFRTPISSPRGSLTIYEPDNGGHWMLSEHCSAEYPVSVEVKGEGRTVQEWKDLPGRDNHLWDCIVGATVAASIAGIRWSTDGNPEARRKRKRVDIEELYKQNQGA